MAIGAVVRLDRRTVLTSAGWILAIVLPVVEVVRALRSADDPGEESALWVLAVLAVFVGYPVGGFLAGRRQPATPLIHAMATGAAAFAVTVVIAVVRLLVTGGLGAGSVVFMLVYLQIAVSLSVLGALVANRRRPRIDQEVG